MRAFIALLALFGSTACNSQATDVVSFPMVAPKRALFETAAPRAALALMERVAYRAKAPSTIAKIVRTAALRIEANDVRRTMIAIDSIVTSHAGIVADARTTNTDRGTSEATIVIRVPATGFSSLVALLRSTGRVRSDAVNSDDITKEYTDLETRLEVKQEAVARLRRLLTPSTGKLADVLAVETALTTAITELEQLKGERKYDDERVAMSTIAVNLVETAALVRAGFFDSVREQFRSAIAVLGASVAQLVYLVTFLAPWLLFAAASWRAVQYLRARRKVVS